MQIAQINPAYVTGDQGAQSLWVDQIATNSDRQIIPRSDTDFGGLTLSPDGDYILGAGTQGIFAGVRRSEGGQEAMETHSLSG
jgi:hypothetical protein